MNNESYNKVKDEVVKLDEFLEKINFKIKKMYISYNEASIVAEQKRELVDYLNKQELEMLSKYDQVSAKIFRSIVILGFIGLALFSTLNIHIILMIVIMVIAFLGCMIGGAIIGMLFDYKIKPKLLNKIKTSKEYKELLEKIKKAEKELELSSKKEERKHKILKWQESVCKQVTKKRNDKQIILNYLDNEINPKERMGNYSRKLKKKNNTTT